MGCNCNRNKAKILINQNEMARGPKMTINQPARSISNVCPKCGSVMRVFNKFDSNTKRMIRKSVCNNSSCKYSI